MIWSAVLLGSAGCYALKLAGLSLPLRVLDRPVVQRAALLLPIALLSALIATQSLATGHRLHADARLVGVAVAVVAVWRRAPFLLVVVLAAGSTALCRVLS